MTRNRTDGVELGIFATVPSKRPWSTADLLLIAVAAVVSRRLLIL